MSEKLSEKSEMSEVTWASEILRTRIAPPGSGESKKERIRAAANRLRWKFSRARDIWYADDRVSMKPREVRKIEEVPGVTYGQREVREIEEIIGRADALLEGQDADFYRPFVAALRAFAGALDRTGTE